MVADKKISIKSGDIYFDGQEILILEIKENAELDLEETKLAFEIYKQLGVGHSNKALQLMLSADVVSISPEARKYASEQGKYFFKASAIVGSSLSVRLIVNFFNRFYKHDVPFKLFSNEEQARTWLEKYR